LNTFWTLISLVLIVGAGLYMFLRWRHSPKAYKAMIGVSITSWVAGSMLGACIYRLTDQATPTVVPSRLTSASPLPAPRPPLRYGPARAVLPDPNLTPGDTFPGVTAADVCMPGWATEHRHVTPEMRAKVYSQYGYNYDHCQGPERGVLYESCEVDHLIPLELGGSNALSNLWPQPYSCGDRQNCVVYDPRPGACEKDQLENELHHLVCTSKMTLADAQHCIATNWVTCWEKYDVRG
jgi:hypothetical protein